MSKDVLAATIGGRRMRLIGLLAAAVMAIGLVPWVSAETAQPHGWGHSDDRGKDKFLFFASDGLMQQSVEKYADQGVTPGFRELLKHGARASDHGLLTQAPPNTGAGWFTLATGAWPGVHGSTNNTFHKNGDPFGQTATHPGRTAAFDAGVLQAETLAQSAERGGKKVAQIEWAGGRGGAIDGPTVDFRNFFSGRGVATNYISPLDDAAFTASFGLQFDHPAGFAGRPPFADAAPTDATGWTNVPPSRNGVAKQMRLRVLDGVNPSWVDKYGLNAYIYDSKSDGRVRYDRVLFSPTKNGNDKVGDLKEGEWADVKVKLQTTNAFNGKTGAFLVKVERLASDLSQVRLFHTSVTRSNATWPTWPGEPGFTGDFEDFVAERFPSSQAGDFAVLEAGIVSEETYIEQGLYWETGHHPLIRYILDKYKPDLAMVGYPVTDEVQHQFLGLVTKRLPNGAKNPAYDDVQSNGTPDGRVKQREAFIRRAYQGSDATMRLAQDRLKDKDLTTFVSSDHGFAPQFLAIDASKVLVDLGLLARPQTSNCRPQSVASGETIGKAKACYAGGALQIYLNVGRSGQRRRLPADPGRQRGHGGGPDQGRVRGARGPQRLDRRRPARGLGRDRPDLHEGRGALHPERRRQHRRHVAPDADGRPGRLRQPAVPVRRGDARHAVRAIGVLRPARLRAGRAGPRHQHQHAGHVPGRRQGDRPRRRPRRPQHRPRADRGVPARRPGAGAQPGRRAARPARGRQPVPADLDRGAERLPRSARPVDAGRRQRHRQQHAAAPAQLATMFDEEADALPGRTLLLAAGDNVGASPPSSALLQDIPTIDVENAWGLDATSFGNHEFDFGIERILLHQDRANFPFLATNVVETATGRAPDWMRTTKVFRVNGMRVGVIGSVVRNTPELVKPGNTAGLAFLDEAERIERASRRLRRWGVKIQVVVIHEGAVAGANRVDGNASAPWDGPIIGIVDKLQNTTVDLVIAGHTHRAANTVVGRIPIVEGFNAGISYSVAQLMVRGDDVAWTGAATRTAKNLGVTPRADVKAIVDKANADTAPLRNVVIGSSSVDILRDNPARLRESDMGNVVADAMRAKYAEDGVQAAITNSGGLREDFIRTRTAGGEAVGEITWGEAFAVLPFGNSTVIETVTYEQLRGRAGERLPPAVR